MSIRFYKDADYEALISLYKKSTQFSFDEVTDSRENLSKKIQCDPESLIVVDDASKIVGSVSLIEDGRIALLFRLVVDVDYSDADAILKVLGNKAEEVCKSRGYKELHSIGPAGHIEALKEREMLGFAKGKNYTWFWKKIS